MENRRRKSPPGSSPGVSARGVVELADTAIKISEFDHLFVPIWKDGRVWLIALVLKTSGL